MNDNATVNSIFKLSKNRKTPEWEIKIKFIWYLEGVEINSVKRPCKEMGEVMGY